MIDGIGGVSKGQIMEDIINYILKFRFCLKSNREFFQQFKYFMFFDNIF